MSQDVYQLDRYKHGGVHVDRYNRQGTRIGRYRIDGSPLKTKGKLAPPIPNADIGKFVQVISVNNAL